MPQNDNIFSLKMLLHLDTHFKWCQFIIQLGFGCIFWKKTPYITGLSRKLCHRTFGLSKYCAWRIAQRADDRWRRTDDSEESESDMGSKLKAYAAEKRVHRAKPPMERQAWGSLRLRLGATKLLKRKQHSVNSSQPRRSIGDIAI